MNTKTEQISSGLVAVAWQVRNGWSSCDLYRTLKSATEDRDMLQKRADFAGNLMAYRVEPLVRLSDAEAIIAQKDAEILEQCRINGMGAEREAALLGKVERQSAALKLAKQALTSITEKPRAYEGIRMASLPLPKDHWLYAERGYEEGAIEPKDLPAPILTHALRQQVIDAIRYAVRSATNCGKEDDFDPDALVQNAVYALCGPYGAAAPTPPVSEDRKDAERYHKLANYMIGTRFDIDDARVAASSIDEISSILDAMQEDKP